MSSRTSTRAFRALAVVLPGTPLIEVGDPNDLEIAVDVLSSDAVAIAPGEPVMIEEWGGEQPLDGRVELGVQQPVEAEVNVSFSP